MLQCLSYILVVRLYRHVGVFFIQFVHLFLNEGRLARIHQKMGLVQIFDDEMMLLVQEEQELLHRSIAAPHHCWSAVGYLRRRRQRTKSPALLSWRVPLARREKKKEAPCFARDLAPKPKRRIATGWPLRACGLFEQPQATV